MTSAAKLIVTVITVVIVTICGLAVGIPMMWMAATGADEGACGLIDLDGTAIGHGAADGPWSPVQVDHAITIVEVGISDGVPARGWTIALATAMQESSLKNYANSGLSESLDYPHDAVGSDHDSVGLFQQRPAAGWGTVAELMDPATSSRKFYNALMAIEGWQSMSLTEAAQAVQKSAFPHAYAKWESEAAALTDLITDGAADAIAAWGCGTGDVIISASGWTTPLDPDQSQFWGGFRTDARPDHYGVDLGAESGTPIRAVANGVVRYSECNSATCAVPGTPEMAGCGWMTVIDHGKDENWQGLSTRYCHMLSEPLVDAGDVVTVGQIIGYVGSTGRSSAPHLHYEVHYGTHPSDGRLANATTVDPVPVHSIVQAPLQ